MDAEKAATGSVERREVDLATLEELAEEVDRVMIATERGEARTTGKWTVGQILEHLAKAIEFAIDGFPFRPPWWMRIGMRFKRAELRRRILGGGFELPAGAAALLPHEAVTVAAGAARLRTALTRLRHGEKMGAAHPALGRMTHEQWVEFHLRHAEHHLGRVMNDD